MMTALYSAPMRRNEKKSQVWKYFMEMENSSKTTCLLCNKAIACNQGSTSNLKKHLMVAHKMFQTPGGVESDPKKMKMVDLMSSSLKEEMVELDGEIFEIDRQDALDNYEIIGDEVLGTEAGLVSDAMMLQKLPVKQIQLDGTEQYVLVAVDQNEIYDMNSEENDPINFLHEIKGPAASMHYAPLEIPEPDTDMEMENDDSKRYSLAWQYFRKVAKNKYGCKICGKELTFMKSTNSTSANLLRHLRHSHGMNIKNNKPPKHENEGQAELTYNSEEEERPLVKKERLHSLRSHVWNYFTRVKKNLSKCNHCGRLINMHYSSSSNMIKHLKQMHPRAANMLQRTKEVELQFSDKDRGGMEQNTKNAIIWKAFSPTKFSATCKICHTFMPSNKPGLLWCHLKSRHLNVFNKLKPSSERKKMDKKKVKKRKEIAEKVMKREGNSVEFEESMKETTRGSKDGRSVVWKFFIKRKGACLCILCKHMLDNKNRSTTNLWKHVRALHANTIEFIMNPENEDKCNNRQDLVSIASQFEEVDVCRGNAFLFFNKKGKSAEEFFKHNQNNLEFTDNEESQDEEDELLIDEDVNDNESIRSSDSEDENKLLDVDSRRSIVWKFFRLAGDFGKCVYCGKMIKKESNGKTLTFHQHLRQHHFKVYTRKCAQYTSLPQDANFIGDEELEDENINIMDKLEQIKLKKKVISQLDDNQLREDYAGYFHSLGTLNFCQLCNESVENLVDPAEHIFWAHRENFIITVMQTLQDDNIDTSWSDELLKPIPKFLLNYFTRIPALPDRSVTLCRICYDRIEPVDEDVDRHDVEEEGFGDEVLIMHLIKDHLPIFVSRDPLNIILESHKLDGLSSYGADKEIKSIENVWLEHCSMQEKNYDAEINSMRKILKAKEDRLNELEEDVMKMYANIAMRQEIRRQEVNRILSLNHQLLRPHLASEQVLHVKDFLSELDSSGLCIINEKFEENDDQIERDVKFSEDNAFTENQLHDINEHYRLNKTTMPKIKICKNI